MRPEVQVLPGPLVVFEVTIETEEKRMKKKALLTGLLGAAAALFMKKSKAKKAEQDLWNEAGQAGADLR